MNALWFLKATEFNGLTLWAIAISVTVLVVLVACKLRCLVRWRAVVIGIAVTLFAAPVDAMTFDPWWMPPWPSLYFTVALLSGEWYYGIGYFPRQFVLPPIGWGFLSALAWYWGHQLLLARRHYNPPPFA